MTTALVVVAPATRHPAGVRTLENVLVRVAARLPGVPLRVAYDARRRPTVAEALADPGGPAAVVPLVAPDVLLVEVAAQRLLESGARPGQPVVLAVCGAADSSALGDAARAARMLAERWRAPVRAAHLTGHGERMASVVADLARQGLEAPAVAPYLLGPGEPLAKARGDAASLGLTTAAPFGDHASVAEAVVRRYRATAAHQFALSLA